MRYFRIKDFSQQMSRTCTDCEAYLLQSNSFQILNNSLYARTIVRHASQPEPRGMPLAIGTEACLSSWGMPLGRNKELLYKVCEIANTVCRVSFLSSLVTRTGYFLVCSCAARRSGLVFIEIAYSQLLLSLKSIWMKKWNHRFT